MLVLLAIVMAAPAANVRVYGNPFGPVYSQSSAMVVGPAFEFAPVSGIGMGTACACALPTGTKGEVFTTTRASSAYCSKQGLSGTGINNGDLVLCGTNQPRIAPDASAVLGYLGEFSRTNSLLASQGFDATWVASGVVVAAPTVTANFATSPDGTVDAERVQISACPGAGNASVVQQDYTGTAATWAGGVFIKGNGGSGNISVYYFDTTASAGNAITCAFNSTTWTWCGAPASPLTRTFANITHRFAFGCINDAAVTGTSDTGAADILAWQADSQVGAYMSMPILTTAGAATRSVDTGLTLNLSNSLGPSACLAVSVQFEGVNSPVGNVAFLGVTGTSEFGVYKNSDTSAGFDIGGTAVNNAVASMGSTTHRFLLRDNGGTRTALFDNSAVTAPAATMASSQTLIRIGAAGAPAAGGIVSRFQVGQPFTCSGT